MNILYEDESILVVDKPNKMLVYPSPIARNCNWFATKELEKIGYTKLHTVHRLDRPTSGVLLFAKNPSMAKEMSLLFRNKEIKKTYVCLVRGFTEDEGLIERELKKDGDGEFQTASTYYQTLEKNTVDLEISKYPQSRFSFLKVEPITGRMHQIRRHLAHLRHPIIGDKRYGDRHYNRYMKEKMNMENLMLHAYSISFIHPLTKNKIEISAPIPETMKKLLDDLGFSKIPVLLQNVD
jgi:tRNA pseudouridine65 synthase